MKTYSFTFVVGDANPHDEEFENRFFDAGCDDATLVLMHGAVAVCFEREHKTYKDAVFSAYENVLSTGANLLRFEPDYLVSASEIAMRSGLSKAAISLYEKGERGEGYPKPYACITTPRPLWDWTEVSRWLCLTGKIDEASYREAQVTRVVNFGVQLKESLEETRSKLEIALNTPVAA